MTGTAEYTHIRIYFLCTYLSGIPSVAKNWAGAGAIARAKSFGPRERKQPPFYSLFLSYRDSGWFLHDQ